MYDLETTVVITPAIPHDDMTLLERLVLSHVFDAGEIEGGLLLSSDWGAKTLLHIPAIELAAAYTASLARSDSDLNQIIGQCRADARPLTRRSR